MPLWPPALDPAHSLACAQPERYVLSLLPTNPEQPDARTFLGLDPTDQSVLEVSRIGDAHHFLTHEAALRAAAELNRLGRGPLDVVKVGESPGGRL
ncbi:MAG: hypothetical protein ACK6AD_07195 [Cyanobacteriota bacterium]